VSDLERLASRLQWPVDRPAANGVAFLGTGYHPMNSFAMVRCRDDVAISIVVPMTDRINSWFPGRVGAFAQTVAAATSVLGLPAVLDAELEDHTMPDLNVMPAEQVTDAVTRLMRVRWSWLIADVDRLVDQLGWPLEQPAAHGVAYLQTGYPSRQGRAMVMYRQDRATSVGVAVTSALSRRFPDRVGAFAAAADTVADVLGPPPDRRPGEWPEVWWPAADGIIGLGTTAPSST
jgi:Family of unknown function (DUF6301)